MEIVFMVISFFGLIALGLFWQSSRGDEMLQAWAASNRFEIVKSSYCFFKGPYFWTSGKGQRVYEVWLRDESGRDRHGYVRCGGYFLGMWSDHAEAILDK